MEKIITDDDKIEMVLTRGVEEVIDVDHLRTIMRSGSRLRIKLGIDPTSAFIHLGRTIPLLKLRDFQELGHQIVFIVGDFTGIIGDTSDKNSERPMLSLETINENLKTYKMQISKILDISKVEFRQNSEWLGKLTYKEISEQAGFFSVNGFISRELIAKRLKEGKRVSLREVLYPLMQGYDSVAISADVEIGGTDQKFNLLAGRHMQKNMNMKAQDIITGPLIEGTDGRKMSSSWGNVINILDDAHDMFGKIMSLKDDLIIKYFKLLTREKLEKISDYEEFLIRGGNPKDIKMKLAHYLVSFYHNVKDANSVEEDWLNTFSKGNSPKDIKTVKAKFKVPLVDILMKNGLVESKNEFRRLVEQGAIKIKLSSEEKTIIDPQSLVEESGDLRIGKKRFLRLDVKVDKSQ